MSDRGLSRSEGKEELVLQDVVNITPEGATLKLVNLFGEEKVVEGRIRQMDLLSHRIIVRGAREE